MKKIHRVFLSEFGSIGYSLLLAGFLIIPNRSFATAAAGYDTGNPEVQILQDSISIEHFSGGTTSPGATGVPEPTAAALALSSLVVLASRRRR